MQTQGRKSHFASERRLPQTTTSTVAIRYDGFRGSQSSWLGLILVVEYAALRDPLEGQVVGVCSFME
jgi:hypothetical protein